MSSLSCGARTGLIGGEPDGSLDGYAAPDASDGASVDTRIDSTPDGSILDAATDTGRDTSPPPPPCTLAVVGSPVAYASFPEGLANAPDLLVLEPGTPSSGGALVAVKARNANANFWHPEINLAGLRVSPPWPDGLATENPMTLFAFESHEWGTLARGAGETGQLAILWHYAGALVDPPSLRFQTFDTDGWFAHSPVDVSMDETWRASLALAPGRAIGDAAFSQDGYAIIFRIQLDGVGTQPHVAFLDDAGVLTHGPYPLTPPSDYPGRSAGAIWSGSTYLLATSFHECPMGETPYYCSERSVAVLQVVPSDPGRPEPGARIGTLRPNSTPGRPRIAHHAGTYWVVWSEIDTDLTDDGRDVRLARVGGDGSLLSEPVLVASGAHPETKVTISAGRHGVVVMWGEAGDRDLDRSAAGYDRVIIHHFDFDGVAIQAPLSLDAGALDYYPGMVSVALDHPASVLLTWSAQTGPGEGQIHLARLDCVR